MQTLFSILTALTLASGPRDPSVYPVYVQENSIALRKCPSISCNAVDSLYEGEMLLVDKDRTKFRRDKDGRYKDWYFVYTKYNEGWICARDFSLQRKEYISLDNPIIRRFENFNHLVSQARSAEIDSLRGDYIEKARKEYKSAEEAVERLILLNIVRDVEQQ
jgi:hypothetical protein